MREIYIYGASGHGKVVASLLQDSGETMVGFLDDDPQKIGIKILGFPVLGGWDYLAQSLFEKNLSVTNFIVGIGDNQNRKRVFEKLNARHLEFVSAVHPSSLIHSSVRMGKGIVVMPGVIVNADTQIGENAILNTGVSVDHDCVIGDHVHLAPGTILTGGVVIESEVFIGAGAVIVPGVRIGARTVIGAGAVVLQDVPSGKTAVGVPAREI
jgi:UDP-perosamine 4-acetyltransferase